jgi:phenylalanyl-tRNA synthetase beta chain
MKVPLDWLKEYLPTKLSIQEIADSLTLLGLEVEGIRDEILDISLTPNLIHCANIRGVARELAALTGTQLHEPPFTTPKRNEIPIEDRVSVIVEDPIGCPRYACLVITDVHVTPSPEWLKKRLEQSGMRSINAVVDSTNLALLEFGHPLHAFDFDCLEGQRIVVRRAKKEETILAIDGKEYFPTEETLLICDAKKPIAIAGIMGSADTEVTEKTRTVLLEAAYFNPAWIRKAGKQLGIRTEASYRFERGTDPNGILEVLERAASMICELTGGTVLRGTIDQIKGVFTPKTVTCRLSEINRILGTQLAMSEVETLLNRLGLHIVHVKEGILTVKVPTFRHDISQEIDLIEEVARLYGFGNINKKERALFRTGTLPSSIEYLFARKVRNRLIAEGLQEFVTCDLISPMQAALISTDNFPSRTLIKLLNPHSSEQSIMRPSMLPGMLSAVKYNADHRIESVAGFEVGRVHFTSKERFFEPSALSIVLTGMRQPYNWLDKDKKVDFYDLKGIVENLFLDCKIERFSFPPSHYANFHPGRQAAIQIENVEIGIMGEVHPATLRQVDLEHPVYFAELNLEELLRFVNTDLKMVPLPQYPASSRDWTITLTDRLPVGEVLALIEKERSPLLEAYFLLDIYKNKALGPDQKNATFRFIYRDPHATISLTEVEKEHQRITQAISEHLQR